MSLATLLVVVATKLRPWWRLAVTNDRSGFVTTADGAFGLDSVCWNQQTSISCVPYTSDSSQPFAIVFGDTSLLVLFTLVLATLLILSVLVTALRPEFGGLALPCGLLGALLSLAAPLYLFFALPPSISGTRNIAEFIDLPTVSGFFGSGGGTLAAGSWAGGDAWFLSFVASGLFVATVVSMKAARVSVVAIVGRPEGASVFFKASPEPLDPAHARRQTLVRRSAAGLQIAACGAYGAALALSLLAFRAELSLLAGRPVSWREIVDVLGALGLIGLFLFGVLGQAAFAFVALALGIHLFRTPRFRVALIVLGAILSGGLAIAFSFFVFGGRIGAVAGGLSIVSGILAFQASRTGATPQPLQTEAVPPTHP